MGDKEDAERNMNSISSAKMEEVIVVKTVLGDGTKKNPYTAVIQYWTKSSLKIGQIRNFSELNLNTFHALNKKQ